MFCNKCQKKIDTLKKVGFRAVCEYCGSDLHTCVNCKYYSQGKPNDCLVPNSEYVRDREKYNFCEDFFPSNSKKDIPKISKEDVAKKLFKD